MFSVIVVIGKGNLITVHKINYEDNDCLWKNYITESKLFTYTVLFYIQIIRTYKLYNKNAFFILFFSVWRRYFPTHFPNAVELEEDFNKI